MVKVLMIGKSKCPTLFVQLNNLSTLSLCGQPRKLISSNVLFYAHLINS